MNSTASKRIRAKAKATKRARHAFRPRLETLEDRLALATAFGLTDGNALIRFDTASPTAINSTTAITGVTAGETLVGIDFRPQNGLLYGLGVNAAADTMSVYLISQRTGLATVVGTGGFTGAGNLPDPAVARYGFDFNPAVDRIRVTTNQSGAGAAVPGLNFRLNPTTGGLVQADTDINPAGTSIDEVAYTNNAPNVTTTTLYAISSTQDSLFIQNPPNNGTQSLGQTITIGGSTLDFSAASGFDIEAGVNAPSNNAAVTSGSGLAALVVGGSTRLYSINLVNAQATLIGNIGTGATGLKGFAVQSDLGGFPAIGLSGSNLVRTNTATPGTTTTVAITGVNASETLVGIDFRPQTGQLYGLGVNATANTATLYLIDPQTGAATVVGTASQIAYVGADGTTPIDLPDPATAGYGIDFNPTVDRIRVTTSTGHNFRVNPITGAPVDGNLNLTPTPAGTNPDGNINGLPAGSTGVSGTAYTNSFGQSLVGGVTTQYTLDAASNSLFIQNPPNAGTQTLPVPITLNGAALDFTDVNGFDIPASVRVATSNTPATGSAFAALSVGGNTSLFQINLATGAATNLGAVVSTLNGFTLGDRVVAAAATTTILTSSANPSLVGDEVTFTAIVSAGAGGGTPTGTVTFRIDGGSAVVVPLSAGQAQFSTSTLDVGTFTITADYSSNSVNFDGSSATLTQSVVPERPPAGTASLSPDPFIPGNTALIVTGTTRNDSIVVKPVSGQARVILNGKILGNFPLADFDSIVVLADAGNDTVVIAKAILKPTTIDGEGGNDTLIGGNGSDTLIGGDGRDTLVGLGGDDFLFGGDGNDVLDGGSGNDELSGEAGNDTIVGGSGDDVIDGGEGNDTLIGASGNDSLLGGDGNDKVFGGSGDDVARGGLGNDKVFGDAGNDFVLGEEGNDQVYGGAGRDILVGGADSDTLFGGPGDDIVVADTTSIDVDEAAAAEVFAEWTSANSYADRVDNIRALGISIDDDGSIDTLFGEGGLDWFLFSPGDRVRDRARNELVN